MGLLRDCRHQLALRLVMASALAVPAAVAVSAGAAGAAAENPGGTAAAAALASQRSVAASTAGGLLGWGDGFDGQLGDGHRTNVQSTPVRVRLPRGVTVVSVRAGARLGLQWVR